MTESDLLHDYGGNWPLGLSVPPTVLDSRNALHWCKLQPGNMMQIRVLFFGVLKDLVDALVKSWNSPKVHDSSLHCRITQIGFSLPGHASVACSVVNQEYSGPDRLFTRATRSGCCRRQRRIRGCWIGGFGADRARSDLHPG